MPTITTKAPCKSIFCAVHRHPCGGRKRARAKELRAAAKAEAAMSCRFGLTWVENSEILNGNHVLCSVVCSKFMNFNQFVFKVKLFDVLDDAAWSWICLLWRCKTLCTRQNAATNLTGKDIITADITAIATTCNNRSPVELTPAGTKVPAWSTVAVTDWM